MPGSNNGAVWQASLLKENTFYNPYLNIKIKAVKAKFERMN